MKRPASALDPEFRDVFGRILSLLASFERLDEAVERTVTPTDEIGYTIGRFCWTALCKRDPAKMAEFKRAFERAADDSKG